MPYNIQDNCTACGDCQPHCPSGAIKTEDGNYWVDPTICLSCEETTPASPPCATVCSTNALVPLQSKKGRSKSALLPISSLDLFVNSTTVPFASSLILWESCNILAQRDFSLWKIHPTTEEWYYSRPVHRGRGELIFKIAHNVESEYPIPLKTIEAEKAFQQLDIRATCLHLIFAAYAVTLESPWENTFVLTDQQIEQYLGLGKRKDLTKLEKLRLIKQLVHQACSLLVSVEWPRQGKVQGFSVGQHPIWHLIDTQYYFETDTIGGNHLIGLSFTLRAGIWTKRFLNKREYRRQTVFYQYGILPQSLLTEVMSHWQRHEGAIRLMLWLLFKLRLNGDQRIKVSTLLKIAYGQERLQQASTVRGSHKSLLKSFEGDLEALYYWGLKPQFDPNTYSPDIQPLWARLTDIPENGDEALEFWANDANQEVSLTDAAPRDKWKRLLNARLLGFELSPEWQQTVRSSLKKRHRHPKNPAVSVTKTFNSTDLKTTREQLKMSQRNLANRIGKSQSWVRDVENGRFSPSTADQAQLHQILNLS